MAEQSLYMNTLAGVLPAAVEARSTSATLSESARNQLKSAVHNDLLKRLDLNRLQAEGAASRKPPRHHRAQRRQRAAGPAKRSRQGQGRQ